MKTIKQSLGDIVIYCAELALGVLLLVNPVKFTTLILRVTGGALILIGLIAVISYFRLRPEAAMLEHDLSKGLILLAVGIFGLLKTNWVLTVFPALTVLYGVLSLIVGFMKIQGTIDLIRLRVGGWGFAALNAVLTILVSVIVLVNPFTTTVILWRFMAISMIVVSVLDIAALIFSSIKGKSKKDNQNA